MSKNRKSAKPVRNTAHAGNALQSVLHVNVEIVGDELIRITAIHGEEARAKDEVAAEAHPGLEAVVERLLHERLDLLEPGHHPGVDEVDVGHRVTPEKRSRVL